MAEVNKFNKMIILILSIMGVVFFFPLQFENGETCLADHYLNYKNHSNSISVSYESRVNRYLFPCGILWWMSTGVVLYALFSWLQSHKKTRIYNNKKGGDSDET